MSDEGGGAGVVQGHRWLLGSDSGGSGNLEQLKQQQLLPPTPSPAPLSAAATCCDAATVVLTTAFFADANLRNGETHRTCLNPNPHQSDSSCHEQVHALPQTVCKSSLRGLEKHEPLWSKIQRSQLGH